MEGQVAVVTGGSSGIGRAIARELVGLGATVCVTSRSPERAAGAASELESNRDGSGTSGGAVGLALGLGSRESIHSFVTDLEQRFESIDVLIHNAGALTDDFRTDDQGMELTLSTHLVGPYLMTCLLRSRLSDGARVLFMSSGGMYTEGLDVDRLEMRPDRYQGTTAYARAKRAQVELVDYLGPRWFPQVILHAVHPGWVDTPGVDDALPGFARILGPILREPDQGADTMVWLAATGGPGAEAGSFWHDRRARGTVYRPGTSTTDDERRKLVRWLEETTGCNAGVD